MVDLYFRETVYHTDGCQAERDTPVDNGMSVYDQYDETLLYYSLNKVVQIHMYVHG